MTSPARLAAKLHRRVCLVLTEDAVLAEELLARKKLVAEVAGRLSDRALLVKPGLPDANVLIQVSGTFGSRQEEAQRLGRVLRPKSGGESAYFYTLVTRDTRELDFAHHRQMFLTEQGYAYTILDERDVTVRKKVCA